jgi:hypothetical protein
LDLAFLKIMTQIRQMTVMLRTRAKTPTEARSGVDPAGLRCRLWDETAPTASLASLHDSPHAQAAERTV